ncbi:MAG: hypothetical protein ACJ8EL_19425, partial [Rhizomicrobium sp.]
EEIKAEPSMLLVAAAVAVAENRPDEARALYEQARQSCQAGLAKRPDDPEILGDLASADAALGLREEALRVATRAAELCPPSVDALVGPGCLMRVGEVKALSGDRDGAFSIFRELAAMPFGLIYGDLKLNPMWDFLRDDPRFARLVEAAARPLSPAEQ